MHNAISIFVQLTILHNYDKFTPVRAQHVLFTLSLPLYTFRIQQYPTLRHKETPKSRKSDNWKYVHHRHERHPTPTS